MLARTLIVLTMATLPAVGALGPVPPAFGATISPTVFTDDLTDNGNCTLREAIRAANLNMAMDACPAGSGLDTIQLQAGTYGLTIVGGGENASQQGDLDITGDTIISGADGGTSIIEGAWTMNPDRIFHVLDEGTDLTASGITIQGGELTGPGGGILVAPNTTVTLDRVTVSGNSAGGGGGIYNEGSLTLQQAAVSGNTATGIGGGIETTPQGTMSITDSSISGNVAANGAGLNLDGTATLSGVTVSGNRAEGFGGGMTKEGGGATTLTNVTVSGNTAGERGGGIQAVAEPGEPYQLNNVTITGNHADSDGDGTGDGGGIFQDGSESIDVRNTIVAGNVDGSGQAPDCSGSVTSAGHNLIGTTSGCGFTPGTEDLLGVDPKLGPLADNGGFTQTHALLKGSPAIDAGGSDAATTDQRGLPRTDPDIGAYELVLCRQVPINRIGTAGNDALTGTSGADGFLAQDGNDTAKGLGGADAACMGGGKDTASGGGGKDTLLGEAGKDKLKGQGGKDVLKGGPGKDTCTGGGGKDKAACETEKRVP